MKNGDGLKAFNEIAHTMDALDGVSGIAHRVRDITPLHAFRKDCAIFDVLLALELGILGGRNEAVTVVICLLLGSGEGGAARESEDWEENNESFHNFILFWFETYQPNPKGRKLRPPPPLL